MKNHLLVVDHSFEICFITQVFILILEEEGSDKGHSKVHFYVYCPTCKDFKTGKLRVRCHFCKSGAFTVHSDPQNWTDVLQPKQITGLCENNPEFCSNVCFACHKLYIKQLICALFQVLNNKEPTFAEFYFKCSEHTSLGESDEAVPLYLIRPNLKEIPCLACADIEY